MANQNSYKDFFQYILIEDCPVFSAKEKERLGSLGFIYLFDIYIIGQLYLLDPLKPEPYPGGISRQRHPADSINYNKNDFKVQKVLNENSYNLSLFIQGISKALAGAKIPNTSQQHSIFLKAKRYIEDLSNTTNLTDTEYFKSINVGGVFPVWRKLLSKEMNIAFIRLVTASFSKIITLYENDYFSRLFPNPIAFLGNILHNLYGHLDPFLYSAVILSNLSTLSEFFKDHVRARYEGADMMDEYSELASLLQFNLDVVKDMIAFDINFYVKACSLFNYYVDFWLIPQNISSGNIDLVSLANKDGEIKGEINDQNVILPKKGEVRKELTGFLFLNFLFHTEKLKELPPLHFLTDRRTLPAQSARADKIGSRFLSVFKLGLRFAGFHTGLHVKAILQRQMVELRDLILLFFLGTKNPLQRAVTRSLKDGSGGNINISFTIHFKSMEIEHVVNPDLQSVTFERLDAIDYNGISEQFELDSRAHIANPTASFTAEKGVFYSPSGMAIASASQLNNPSIINWLNLNSKFHSYKTQEVLLSDRTGIFDSFREDNVMDAANYPRAYFPFCVAINIIHRDTYLTDYKGFDINKLNLIIRNGCYFSASNHNISSHTLLSPLNMPKKVSKPFIMPCFSVLKSTQFQELFKDNVGFPLEFFED